jgi:hypothetical protein
VFYYEFIESLLSNNTSFLVHVEHKPVKIPWKDCCLPLIYAMHTDFSPTLSVIINTCYILLVEDVRRMGEYCISQQSDQNEGSLLMVVLKRDQVTMYCFSLTGSCHFERAPSQNSKKSYQSNIILIQIHGHFST